MLRPSRATVALVDPERPNLRFERRPWNPQSCRGPGGPEQAPTARAQGILDDGLLARGEGTGQAQLAFDRRGCGQPAFVDGEFVGVRHDDRPLDDVLQLTDVPRPRIRLQAIERLFADTSKGPARLSPVPPDEFLDQHRNVLPPFP